MNHENILYDLYYNKHNLDGVSVLYKKAKIIDNSITLKIIKDWLKKQKVNQLNVREVGRHNIYLPIYSELPYSFQIDLTFFPRYADYNNGYTILFTAININTRFAYAYKMRDKTMKSMMIIINLMEKKTVINSITCDEGLEFNNKDFIKFCKDNDIIIYFIKNDSHKLGIINRFHRTFKEKLIKYFIANDTVKWINVYDDIINNYNNSVNRGIGIEPNKVNSFIENEIIQEKKGISGVVKENKPDFIIGDRVRLKRKDILFNDKMLSKYEEKIYIVNGITANSLYVEYNNNFKKVKKSTAIKVNDEIEVYNNIIPVIEEANIKHRKKVKFTRTGLDEKNIIEGKRVRKPINNV